MDEESLWCLAMLVAIHNGSSFDEASLQAAMAADVADEALKQFYERFPDDAE